MFKTTLIFLALIALGAGAPMALAQHGHGHSGHQSHDINHTLHEDHATHGIHNGIHLPSDEVLIEWGCDEEMVKSLRNLEDQFEKKSIDLKVALEKAELELERAHENESVSETTLHSDIDGFFEAKSDLLKLHATAAVQAREIMGEELFQKIHEAHRD
jgi:hypothetical protein